MNARAHGMRTVDGLDHGSTYPTEQVCIEEYVDACQRSCVLLQLQVYSPGRSRSHFNGYDASTKAGGAVNAARPVDSMPGNLHRSIGAVVKRARRYLESHSCPFGDCRQVLISEYQQIKERLVQFEHEYQQLVGEATSDWDGYLRQVNQQADEPLLPGFREEYLAQCRFEVAILPMPEYSAQTILPDELAAEVKTQMRASVHQQYRDAQDALVDQCTGSLQLAVERVISKRRTTAATFRAASEAAGRICRFNVSHDEQLEALAATVRTLVQKVDPKQCNTSEIYKLEVVSDINNLLMHIIDRRPPSESD